MKLRILFFGLWFLLNALGFSQQIDLENIGSRTEETLKKNPFSISGSTSANGVYTHSSENGQVLQNTPFLYFLSGNISLGVYNWAIPFSYRFTNQGSKFGYQIPFKFNRLSLHPKYKWIQAHIGDVSMSFSPYTFNGLQFTGGGLELNPEKFPVKASLMGGRLQKVIEYDGNPQTVPTYERWGYGAKLMYKNDDIEVGGILFFAKDKPNSLVMPIPDEKKIYPLENQTYSLFGKYRPLHFVEVFGEYALSMFSYVNEPPKNYAAYNTGINFLIGKASIGLRYESVAPDYKTLGAYYFVNDMENITLNGSMHLFQGNVMVSGSVGKQRDNLSGQKVKQSNQWVGSMNVSAKVSQSFTLTGSYSNFTMFTNRQTNPFEKLNNPQLYEQPQDSIRYRQVSQNVAVNLAYTLSENQQLTLNYTLNDVVNRENEIVRRGGISRFHNAGINYSLLFPNEKLSITPSLNYTHNWVAREKSQIFGPSILVTKSFFEDKLSTSLGGNYSRSVSAHTHANTANIQLGAGYSPWKNHQFTLSAVQSFRNSHSSNNQQRGQESNISIGYTYHFDKKEIPLPKFRFKKKEKRTRSKEKDTRSKEKDTRSKEKDTRSKEKDTRSKEKDTRSKEKDTRSKEKDTWSKEKDTRDKEKVIRDKEKDTRNKKKDNIKERKILSPEEKLEQDYRMFVFRCLQNLYRQAYRADGYLKSNLFAKKRQWDKEKTPQLEAEFRKVEEGYVNHLWMMQQLEGLTLQDVIEEKGLLQNFGQLHKEDIYETLQKNITAKEKMDYISVLLADFYHKASTQTED
ncbi:TonB-dependent receptor [Capnocytophaga canimorsus]|uniref:TonB-dependent receptor n=1 Tax=Capnocytophaga canimorsus TaxID=28188 RepID=UPI0037D1AD98